MTVTFSTLGQALVPCPECDRGRVVRSNQRHLRCFACKGTGVRLLDSDTLMGPLKSAAGVSRLSTHEFQRLALVARKAATEAQELAAKLDARAREQHEAESAA